GGFAAHLVGLTQSDPCRRVGARGDAREHLVDDVRRRAPGPVLGLQRLDRDHRVRDLTRRNGGTEPEVSVLRSSVRILLLQFSAANNIRCWPARTVRPTWHCTSVTSPSAGATTSISIFIDSSSATTWPAWTLSPGSTRIFQT